MQSRMADAPLIASLTAALEAAPGDTTLRLHLADLLLASGDREGALRQLGTVLEQDPASTRALELIAQAATPRAPAPPIAPEVDWAELERDLDSAVEPMFVEGDPGGPAAESWEVERETLTLADVGGLAQVKERLEVAFLAPLRNPELRKLYRKDLRGGLLLYGPPGCGKGFVARALAGELEAAFIEVSINDVLDMFVGNSERNLHEIFVAARRAAPTVLFFDELDALGRKRSQLSNNAMRTTVNQLLHELDGVGTEERERLRARRDQPPMGRRRRAATARALRSNAAGPAAGRGGKGGDLPHPPRRPARDRHRHASGSRA